MTIEFRTRAREARAQARSGAASSAPRFSEDCTVASAPTIFRVLGGVYRVSEIANAVTSADLKHYFRYEKHAGGLRALRPGRIQLGLFLPEGGFAEAQSASLRLAKGGTKRE